MDRIRNIFALVRGQLWPVPALIMVAAAGLAWFLLTHGQAFRPGGDTLPWWIYSGEAATARQLLASLLSGLMTMTSLVVSITFVILTLAANQLGPRLIAIFMGDRQIQGVLGLFIGTILYVVLILRTLDDALGEEGVPHLAVTTATVLTILCLIALLFYLHKIARLIIADNVIESVGRDLCAALQDILPDTDRDWPAAGAAEAGIPTPLADWPVSLDRAGHVQVVDYDRLVKLACKADIIIDAHIRAGHHLLRGGAHLTVRAPIPPGPEVVAAIRAAFTIGTVRTPAQDPEQGIRHLVEIATRALSPGTNDPFTALAVIDRLGIALELAFGRHEQQRNFRDDAGVLRVTANRSDIAGIVDASFHPIRQAGIDHPAILIALAEVILRLIPALRRTDQQRALAGQLDRLAESAALGQTTPLDRSDITARINAARQALGAMTPG